MQTSLNSREKISKASFRIELRGKLDSLNAQIIFFQTCSENQEYISDLEQIREVINKLQKCEACEKIFSEKLILFETDENELHLRSHNPTKFYGKGHILPHYEMKREAAGINFLRTLVRETEICACRAFDEDIFKIIHVLNRLSSALYVLTYKYLPENYNKTIKFGA